MPFNNVDTTIIAVFHW